MITYIIVFTLKCCLYVYVYVIFFNDLIRPVLTTPMSLMLDGINVRLSLYCLILFNFHQLLRNAMGFATSFLSLFNINAVKLL